MCPTGADAISASHCATCLGQDGPRSQGGCDCWSGDTGVSGRGISKGGFVDMFWILPNLFLSQLAKIMFAAVRLAWWLVIHLPCGEVSLVSF